MLAFLVNVRAFSSAHAVPPFYNTCKYDITLSVYMYIHMWGEQGSVGGGDGEKRVCIYRQENVHKY